MEDNRWRKFTLCGDYTTDLHTLYQAWTTPAGLEKWFLRKADFYSISARLRGCEEQIKKGDTYAWYWHGYGNDQSQGGTVLDINGQDMIKFSFTGDSIVTVKFKMHNGLTIIEIEQTNIPPQDDPEKNLLVQCQVGWTFYLSNLKSVTEGGKDLRNKRIDMWSCFK